MIGNKPKVLVGIVGALTLVVAVSSHSVAATSSRDQGLASAPGSGAEFEAIGKNVGWGKLPSKIRHTPTGVVLVLIPPGKFKIGSPKSEASRDHDEVQRKVTIDSAFYLGETEVTIAQWTQVMATLPQELEHKDSELPVQGVSWNKAKEFVGALNKAGKTVWRLPTEAEWEYACRAGTASPFSFGDDITPSQVNYNGQQPYADGKPGLNRDMPVGVRTLPPNPWGLYEMHGNVWEWCEDLYAPHPELGAAKNLPGASRVLRGGAWMSKGKQLRSANRDGYPPSSSGAKYGLRLVTSIAALK